MMYEITDEIKAKAKYFEGPIPEQWNFLGIVRDYIRNTEIRKRFYETPDGEYYFVVQRKEKKRNPKIDIREEAGYTFGKKTMEKERLRSMVEQQEYETQAVQQAFEIPIPEGAKPTNPKKCGRCRYSIKVSGCGVCCDYLSITKQRRNCPVGWCDKYEPRPRKRRTKK